MVFKFPRDVENKAGFKQVVEDEDFDYPTPPPIFLSYQWGHQEEVKLIRHHLEMAGYDCWMDIGQMGGGDKLFEKIDKGIRAAKIIVSCTTEKYAKSPNCNREVNLSVNLKKPIIPLLLENCSWPPEGSMGPIFSEYLYIQFYQTKKDEETKDDRFWSVPKFQELLMQLNMNGIVPDESRVYKIYRNWWKPLVEKIKIDKSKTFGGGNNNTKTMKPPKEAKEAEASPDVFISYQWDKQKNIMLLYKRLTELGYHCWMDIYQMGGGDSLYDKIDRGIRGCKVVVSCITDNYSLSANCRREISLCDSLKRPIIPLLLENITWPPKGPMSMAFTQLLYIDLHSNPDLQEKWSGPKFKELESKINEIVPNQIPVPKPDPESKTESVTLSTDEPSSPIPKPTSVDQSPAKVKRFKPPTPPVTEGQGTGINIPPPAPPPTPPPEPATQEKPFTPPLDDGDFHQAAQNPQTYSNGQYQQQQQPPHQIQQSQNNQQPNNNQNSQSKSCIIL